MKFATVSRVMGKKYKDVYRKTAIAQNTILATVKKKAQKLSFDKLLKEHELTGRHSCSARGGGLLTKVFNLRKTYESLS